MKSYILDIIEKFGNSTEAEDCFIIVPVTEKDEVEQLLSDYTNKEDGEWLCYDIQPVANRSYYIVRLF